MPRLRTRTRCGRSRGAFTHGRGVPAILCPTTRATTSATAAGTTDMGGRRSAMVMPRFDLAPEAHSEHNKTRKEEPEMTLSDQLSKLAARTKELEDRASAAHQKARADLEHEVAAAREESKANAEALRDTVDADAADVSAWWTDLGHSWDE